MAKKTKTPSKPPIKTTNLPSETPDTRRPPLSEPISITSAEKLNDAINDIKRQLETYSMHMRPLDRKRLNSIGVRNLGFTQQAFKLAMENPEFLPHWLSQKKFEADDKLFQIVDTLLENVNQVREIIWNIRVDCADILYTDSLEFYSQVQDAAKRRVDAAESPFKVLKEFFRKPLKAKTIENEPTEKQLKKDVNALLHGKRDGNIVIENIKPKTTGGMKKIVDEKFQDTVRVKKTEDEDIEE